MGGGAGDEKGPSAGSAGPEGLEPKRLLPRFASVVAHELRNPLSAVKIALQTLERHAELAPKDSTRLRIALREVATIERVLSDILDWARPPDVRPVPVTCADLLERAERLARRDLDECRAFVVREGPLDCAALADPDRIAVALAELLRNAAQAGAEGGEVRVRAGADGGRVTIEVLDSGSGLDAEGLERAFEPFYSRRARGVGLGLPRARNIARAHGGDVTLALAPAGGARAALELPGA